MLPRWWSALLLGSGSVRVKGSWECGGALERRGGGARGGARQQMGGARQSVGGATRQRAGPDGRGRGQTARRIGPRISVRTRPLPVAMVSYDCGKLSRCCRGLQPSRCCRGWYDHPDVVIQMFLVIQSRCPVPGWYDHPDAQFLGGTDHPDVLGAVRIIQMFSAWDRGEVVTITVLLGDNIRLFLIQLERGAAKLRNKDRQTKRPAGAASRLHDD